LAHRRTEGTARLGYPALVAHRLAIDLGSSNTVAMWQGPDGQVRPLLFDGNELLPSAVCVDPTGAMVVGRDAERLARADPAAYEPCPKRRVDDGTVLLGGHAMDVRDLLAAVLSRAAELRPVHDEPVPVVLTCPAGWGAPRRRVLAEAGAGAGLHSVTLVSEPVAAAAYFMTVLGHDLPPSAALAVVDLGAGTADVAVVRHGLDGGDGLDVVAQAGLEVGGVDIDAALVERLGTVVGVAAPEVWRAVAHPASRAERADRLVLWQEVRAAKESLSRISAAPVHVPGYQTGLHLTRDELEAVATPLLAPIGELAAQVVAAAGLRPGELAGVFLVGGGSRIPLLARLLHARLAVTPTVVERPETVVAEGALHVMASTGAADALPADASSTDVPPDDASAATLARPGRRWSSMGRWPSPVALILALLCFLLPFATVSCGLPDGYGRAKPSGTTTYTGVDLVVGGTPDVPAEHLRPQPERRDDRLAPQPVLLAALLTAAAAAVTAIVVRVRGRRRAVTAALATASALALLAGQAVVVDLLATRIRAQGPLPAGRTAHDFVGTGAGFWLALTLLTGTAIGNAIGLLRHRRAGTGHAAQRPP
jgi:actin-like ATPase involved in cell morphogenesis